MNNFFKQNKFAVKTLWNISKSRVIHSATTGAIGYFEWLFGTIFFLRYIIQEIERGANFSRLAGFILLAGLILAILSLYSSYVDAMVKPLTGHTIRRSMYAKLYSKARNVELFCYEDADFYNRYTMALDDADGKITKSVETFFQIVSGLMASAVAFYVMFTIDPFAVLFIIFPLLGNFLLGSIFGKLDGEQYRENTPYNRKSDYVGRVLYLAEFAKEVRMSNVFKLMSRRYDEAVAGNRKVADKYGRKATMVLGMKNILTFTLVFDGILFYAAFRGIVSQTIGLADLAIMFSAMITTTWIFIGMFGDIVDSLKNCVYIGYLRDFMEYKEEVPEDQDGQRPDSKINRIEFRNVSFVYKGKHSAIRNCSFVISDGQTVAFAGHNGAGKSTLIKLLFRLYDPTEGEILVNGVNIKEYNLKAYRKLFAAAFQDYKVFSMSLLDNVIIAGMNNKETNSDSAECKESYATAALKQAGVWDEAKGLAKGINTTLTKEFDENGAVLSEGNFQKVVVARAFAKAAPIQVYDEPSSALDPIAEYNLYSSIMKAAKGYTTLFISHRLSSVADADIIFVMEHGEIIERGSHDELMEQNGKYADMYTKQAKSYLADLEDMV